MQGAVFQCWACNKVDIRRTTQQDGNQSRCYLLINPNHTGVSESLIICGGGGKWPTGENRIYRPYFGILSIKHHIKGF